MEKQRWLCCTSSHVHRCKDVSWARFWGLSIIATARTPWCHCHTTVWVYQKCFLESGWCSLRRDWHCLCPFLCLQRTWGSACDIYCSRGTKALLSLQQSIFISCSNKSSERGGNKWYDCLVCQALSSAHCCASMSPPTPHSFGTAKPLIAFVALIRTEVLHLGCLSFLPLFCSLQYIHIFICI